jgi:hypothetical protein
MKQTISRHLPDGIPGKVDQEEILTSSIRLELEKLAQPSASAGDFHNWIANRRKMILSSPVKERMAC